MTMTTARDLMTPGAECVGEKESLVDAARKMRDLDVGALPICGEDNRLKGMLTDRDIVIKCFAEGGDPRTAKAGDFGEGKPVTIGGRFHRRSDQDHGGAPSTRAAGHRRP